ncbi:CRISPR-associated helicase/endonuclease Cas3, partial [[Eubacterium] siraeum]|nr:CRISPR-associated helicase/endonuclease Cas3 [[Eubacterium] siraeum]
QAAGRCNRNGEDDCRNVYIIKLKEEYIEKLGKLKEAQRQCGLIVRKYGCEQLLSVVIMKRYFHDYYEDCACDSKGDMLEYQIRHSNYSLLDLLSCNIIFS